MPPPPLDDPACQAWKLAQSRPSVDRHRPRSNRAYEPKRLADSCQSPTPAVRQRLDYQSKRDENSDSAAPITPAPPRQTPATGPVPATTPPLATGRALRQDQ